MSDESSQKAFGKGSKDLSRSDSSHHGNYDDRDRGLETTPDISEFTSDGIEEETPDQFSDWEEFEYGDEQFLDVGDKVQFKRNREQKSGEITQQGDNNLFGVETTDGESITIESWDIEEYQRQEDELDDVRETLREHFANSGVGKHSSNLEQWTDDNNYRDIQDHIRTAAEKAKQSPGYEIDPQMETATAILATTDKDTADTLQSVQSYAKTDLPEKMTVYRGIDVDADEFLDTAEQKMENGQPLQEPGFQSTSIDSEVAEGFGNVTLEIETEQGVYLREASEFAGEDEILLPAGSEFDVVDVDRDDNTVRVSASGGYDFTMDADFIRQKIQQDGLDYAEAVEEVM